MCLKRIVYLESYRSGHNEAVLKTVWVQAHGGSNPSLSAIQPKLSARQFNLGCFVIIDFLGINVLCLTG